MFKKLVNKIKFIFKGGNMNFELDGESNLDYLPSDDEVGPDKTFKVSDEFVIRTSKSNKDRLLRIMIRTRKFRVKKKLARRINKSF